MVNRFATLLLLALCASAGPVAAGSVSCSAGGSPCKPVVTVTFDARGKCKAVVDQDPISVSGQDVGITFQLNVFDPTGTHRMSFDTNAVRWKPDASGRYPDTSLDIEGGVPDTAPSGTGASLGKSFDGQTYNLVSHNRRRGRTFRYRVYLNDEAVPALTCKTVDPTISNQG